MNERSYHIYIIYISYIIIYNHIYIIYFYIVVRVVNEEPLCRSVASKLFLLLLLIFRAIVSFCAKQGDFAQAFLQFFTIL